MSMHPDTTPKSTRPRVYAPECGPSLTKQSSKDECDINTIMAKYAKTGILEHTREHHGEYGDYAEASTFLESQIIVHEAQEMFNTIPANVRKDFNNSPAEFLEFVQNPDNIPEMIDMGLATLRQKTFEAPEPTDETTSEKSTADAD